MISGVVVLLLAQAASGQSLPLPQAALSFPVACRLGQTCEIQNYVDRDPAKGVWADYRGGGATYDDHNGIDIRLPDLAAQRRGVAVLAAADGTVLRRRDGVPDLSVNAPGRRQAIQNAECGNGVVVGHAGGWETQYCHMAQGSLSVQVGQSVKSGQSIGRIGLSGNTEYPHLHFTVRRGAQMADPFNSDGGSLWRQTPPYQAGAVLNAGFAAQPVTMALIEAGDIPEPTAASDVIVYGRGIDLHQGDVQVILLKSPDGKVLADNRAPALPRNQAQNMVFAGQRRPASGWPSGLYRGEYQIWREGRLLTSRGFEIKLGQAP